MLSEGSCCDEWGYVYLPESEYPLTNNIMLFFNWHSLMLFFVL